MTANKRFKRLVRSRAAKTGESYSAALRHFRPDPGREPMPSPRLPAVNCSFCGKSSAEVTKVIAGPGVYICDECVALCNDVIAEVRAAPDAAPRVSQPSSERLLDWMPSMGRTLSAVEADIAGRVAVLRDAGVPWGRIAEALGLDEPEVQRRFARPATT